jgi:hypothetical protein
MGQKLLAGAEERLKADYMMTSSFFTRLIFADASSTQAPGEFCARTTEVCFCCPVASSIMT